ncbi:hypothetical protein M1146_03500, partial [Patescibacteria group bacterium]|nr:hypothetical protein [Patescibacteria group bacterium]
EGEVTLHSDDPLVLDTEGNKKRKREDEPRDSTDSKKQKTEESPVSCYASCLNTFQDTKETEKPKEPEKPVNKHLQQAFHFFDRNQVGYIKDGDLELLFLSLGLHFSRAEVRDLIDTIWDPSQTRLGYQFLIEK